MVSEPGEPQSGEEDQVTQNIAAVSGFYSREQQKLSASQRAMERFSEFVGCPRFLALILVFVAAWIAANAGLDYWHGVAFDPPPFEWLQGIIGLSALLTTTIVLTRQNRLARLAEQRAHLDLTLTLLTEQKAAKLIHLLEELRRDLPNVRDRHDSDAKALQQSMSPDLVLAALDKPSPESEVLPVGASVVSPRGVSASAEGPEGPANS